MTRIALRSVFEGSLSDCKSTGTLTTSSKRPTAHYAFGGIAGMVSLSEGTSASFSRCGSTVTIAADIANNSNNRMGGFAGQIDGGTYTECYAEGDVIAGNGTTGASWVGGFAGSIESTHVDTSITHSYSRGRVKGKDEVGGFMGMGLGTITLSAVYSAAAEVVGASRVGNLGGDITVSGTPGGCLQGVTGFKCVASNVVDPSLLGNFPTGALLDEVSVATMASAGATLFTEPPFNTSIWNISTSGLPKLIRAP